jgi:hypothetical protein
MARHGCRRFTLTQRAQGSHLSVCEKRYEVSNVLVTSWCRLQWTLCDAHGLLYVSRLPSHSSSLDNNTLKLVTYCCKQWRRQSSTRRSSTSFRDVESTYKIKKGPAALASAAAKRGGKEAHYYTWSGQAVQIDSTPRKRRVTPAAGIHTRAHLVYRRQY